MPNDDETLDDLTTEEVEEEVEEEEEMESDGDAEPAGEEPIDLASAFAALQRGRQDEPEETVETGDDGEGDGPDDATDDDDSSYETVDDGVDEPDGGAGAGFSGAAYQAVSKQLDREAGQAAMRQAVSEMQRQGIRPFTMADLYERDERAGRVIYHNPDDQSRPFSSRMEAQQWIDSFNSQLNQETKRRAKEIYREISKSTLPTKRLLAFAPAYDAMDPDVREVFEDLVEGYEITNGNGDVIGYSCDLEKAKVRAERMAAKHSRPRAQRAPAAKKKSGPQSGPATDIRSHGTASTAKKNEEPETLEDAFRILREQRKAGNR